jgi:hypothetical protein
MRKRKRAKLIRHTVSLALAGMAVGFCPIAEDRERQHIDVEQHVLVVPVGTFSMMSVVASTNSRAAGLTGVSASGLVGHMTPNIWNR